VRALPLRERNATVSDTKKQVELKRSEERALDEFAKTSDFWSRVRAAYAQYGSLTERQYELLTNQIQKDAWKADAQRLNGIPIRNRFRTEDGLPRCADRAKPYCENEATVIVGAFAFCGDHAEKAQSDLDEWRASHKTERSTETVAARPSGGWSDEFDGGGGADVEPF
jgi:hypothetical protein